MRWLNGVYRVSQDDPDSPPAIVADSPENETR